MEAREGHSECSLDTFLDAETSVLRMRVHPSLPKIAQPFMCSRQRLTRMVLLATVIYIFSIVSTRLIGQPHSGNAGSFRPCFSLNKAEYRVATARVRVL